MAVLSPLLCMLLVQVAMIHNVAALSLETSPPPPPPPPTTTMPITTTPGGCETERGDLLGVGETKQYNEYLSCTIYTCESPGQVTTIIGDCFFRPRCVDPYLRPGDCCQSCPNGENCKLPSGEVIQAGQEVQYNGATCRCPEMSWDDFTQDPTKAVCVENPTSPPPPTTSPPIPAGPPPSSNDCVLDNGTVVEGMMVGDELRPDACTFCQCAEDWRVMCAVQDCARPPCEDPVSVEGQCCPVCLPCEDTSEQCRYWAYNGECDNNPGWMRLYCKKSCAVCQAECVDTEQYCLYWSENGYCDSNPVWMKHNCPVSCNACYPRTTPPPLSTTTTPSTTTPITTPPQQCQTINGDTLAPGEEKLYQEPGACLVCSCNQGGGDAMCYYGDCIPPMCVDPERGPGDCCATCPNGNNCRIPSTGEVISTSSAVIRDGLSCECPPQSNDIPGVQRPEHYTAICTPVTTTPPPTTVP